jgi:hypothetical protein
MKFFKTKELSVPSAIIISAIIISISIFLTVLFFFGGKNNRQKLFTGQINSNQQMLGAQRTQQMEQQKQIQEAQRRNYSSTTMQEVKRDTED